MPDPFEAARAKKQLMVAVFVLILVWILPYAIDFFARSFLGWGIYSQQPDVAKVQLPSGRTLGDMMVTLLRWVQWIVSAIAGMVIAVNVLRLVTAE
ncbi:hypothetical protein [Pyrolobus fumarii]|uniref:hypothetical protein n=1 Tax=Pyrolobus fumarii TaxID=54252 RepID=UPI00064E7573|nr:hypothetical protein [Pyrolobus fumarii]